MPSGDTTALAFFTYSFIIAGKTASIFNLFFEKGADFDLITAIDNFGRTILHHAAESGSISTIKYFLDYESENGNSDNPYIFRNILVSSVTLSGYTALHSAAERNHPDVIDLLVNEYGFNINEINYNGETPLHCAAKSNSLESTIILIKLGADLSIKDNEPMTALDIAYQNNYFQIIQVLEESGAPSSEVYSRQASGVPSPAIASEKSVPLNNVGPLDPLEGAKLLNFC